MIIIKYFEWMKIRPSEMFSVYELCREDPKAPDGYKAIKRLSRATAVDLIEEYGLTLVHENSHGKIWADITDNLLESVLDVDYVHKNTKTFIEMVELDLLEVEPTEEDIGNDLVEEVIPKNPDREHK